MMRALREAVRRSPVAGPIADLATAIQNPALARRLLADARRTRTEMAFARELPPPKADAPLLLVLSMSNNVYIAKLECMLAFALRRRGWRIQILTSSLYYERAPHLRGLWLRDLVAFEKLLHSAPVATAIGPETMRRREEPMDFRSVMAWTYRDAWIGPQLLSSVSRQHFEGAPDPRDPSTRAAILDRLATTIGFVHAAEHHLTTERPDLILVNEPNYHVLGPSWTSQSPAASRPSTSSSLRARTPLSSSAYRNRRAASIPTQSRVKRRLGCLRAMDPREGARARRGFPQALQRRLANPGSQPAGDRRPDAA